MKTTRETKWKVAAAVLLCGLAVLTAQVWRAHSAVGHYEALAGWATARLERQAQGLGLNCAARTIPVPCFLPSGLI